MIRRQSEINIETRVQPFGGPGELICRHIINSAEECNGKGRMFAHTSLEPGCGLGYHRHEGESEIYYVLSGSGEYNDNGVITQLKAGDISITRDGEGHALTNTGATRLELIALILYK